MRKPVERPYNIALSQRELNALLAGVLLLQAHTEGKLTLHDADDNGWLRSIHTNGGTNRPLSPRELARLSERVNGC